jgi:hypothetical protein
MAIHNSFQLETKMVTFKTIVRFLSSPFMRVYKRAGITEVLRTVGGSVAVMADIARGIRAGRDLPGQAFFLQLAEVRLVS